MSLQSTYGRIGGLARAAMYDGLEMTAKARKTFRDSFLFGHTCKVCTTPVEIPQDLPLAERQRRADALWSLHYTRVALKAAQKRAKRR